MRYRVEVVKYGFGQYGFEVIGGGFVVFVSGRAYPSEIEADAAGHRWARIEGYPEEQF